MQVKLDEKYQITSDSRQYMLQERKVIQEGDRKGEVNFTTVAHCGTIAQALKSYKELQIRNSNVTTMNEVLELIKEIDRKIDKILGDN